MRSIAVSGDGKSAPMSVLGFGCSALGGRSSRRESVAALSAAFDAGITFFDTARSYGYGQSEGILGEFLRGRREQAFVCTKAGILPRAQAGWKQRLKPVARGILRVLPGLRGAVRRQIGDQFVAGQFSVEAIRSSFETSLRELRTEYVDMLLLHAAPASVLQHEALLEALGRLVESGKARMAGISGEPEVIGQYFALRPKPLKTAQFALNLATMRFAEATRANGDLLLVANHPFGGPAGAAGLRAVVDQLASEPELSEELRAKLDPRDAQLAPELVLNSVLHETGVSAVVPAMMQPAHITSNVRAVESCRFTGEELRALQRVLASRPV